MLSQMKYAFMEHRTVRIVTLSIFAVMMLPLAILSGVLPKSLAVSIVGTSLAGVGLGGMTVVALVLMVLSQNRLFLKPRAYLTMMPPVDRWKVLAGTAAATTIDLAVALSLGIISVLLFVSTFPGAESLTRLGMQIEGAVGYHTVGFNIVEILFQCAQLSLLLLFARTMAHTVFSRISGRAILGILSFLGAAYCLQFFNLLLLPFAGGAYNWSVFSLTIYAPYSNVAASVAYLAIQVLMLAALFVPTAYLMEKKLNL